MANADNPHTWFHQGSQVVLPFLVPFPPSAGRCGSCICQGIHLNSRYGNLDKNELGRFTQCWGHDCPNLAPLAPSGTIWHHLAPSGTLWYHLAPSGTLWHPLAPFGTLLHYLAPSGTLWHHLAPSGTIWHCLLFSRLLETSSSILPNNWTCPQ